MYFGGHEVSQDDEVAFEWYRKAANHPQIAVQCNLGFSAPKTKVTIKEL